MAAIVYILNKAKYNLILKKTAKKIADGKRLLFPDQLTVVRCYQCGEKIPIGSKIVSKPFGCQYRVHYCVPCGKTLHII